MELITRTFDPISMGININEDLPLGTIVAETSMSSDPPSTLVGLTQIASGGNSRNGFYKIYQVTG